MSSNVIDLMQQYHLSEYGIVDMGKVIRKLKDQKEQPVKALLKVLNNPSQRRWHLAAVEGLRVLTAQGESNQKDAKALIDASEALAYELGSDQLTKSINAIAGSKESAHVLIDYVRDLLKQTPSSIENRWLIFFIIATLETNRTAQIPSSLEKPLRTVAQKERMDDRRKEYLRIIDQVATNEHTVVSTASRQLGLQKPSGRQSQLQPQKSGGRQGERAGFDFYDVKMRSKVNVGDDKVKKVKYTQKNGQVRYALRAYTSDNRKLTKFVSKDTWDKVKIPEEKA